MPQNQLQERDQVPKTGAPTEHFSLASLPVTLLPTCLARLLIIIDGFFLINKTHPSN